MGCVRQLKRRLRRRSVLAWSAIAALLLLWFYLYGFGYRADRQTLPGPVLDVGKDKGGAGGAGGAPPPKPDTKNPGPSTSTTMTATTTTKPPHPPATDPAVVLRQGTYQGTTLRASPRFPKAVEAFRGVPYAQDTGGENRFRLPQPLPDSQETFDAVSWGKICPAEGVVQRNMSEDCLNANIYRPAGLVDRDGYEKTDGKRKRKARLPVVVYIHGGGFNTGHGTERNMGSFVSWAEAPMVAVNFNYRVGALGFLPSEVTAREGLLNLGLRDQQMLLEWVQTNIAAFGGDPKKVTVMGLSAGAHSIGHHIVYYSRSANKAPFSRAILESGATTARAVFYPTHPRHLNQFREFLIAAGAAGVPEDDIFAHLRKLPLETIVEASKVVWDKYVDNVTWPFQPVIDGPNPLANSSQTAELTPASPNLPPIIPDLPINSWLAGAHLRIPIITGFNTNEGTSFVPEDAATNADFRAFFRNLIPSLSATDLDYLEALYPDPVTDRSSPYKAVPRGKGKQWARLDAAYAHYAYICPVLQTAHFMTSPATSSPPSSSLSSSTVAKAASFFGSWGLGNTASGSGAGGSRVYVYRYAATAAHGTANHDDEAPVVAHDWEELKGMKGLQEVSKAMHSRWAAFVVDGVPTGPGEKQDDGEGGWPVFVSPFAKDEGDGGEKKGKGEGKSEKRGAGKRRQRKQGREEEDDDDGEEEEEEEEDGKIMVFGEGNNEGGGGKEKGVPTQVMEMTPLEMAACRFWWERVWLSEGLGSRENEKSRAKL